MFYKAATPDGLDGRCMECVKAARRRRYEANPFPDRQQAAAWAKANPEKSAKASRKHYDRNVEAMRDKARERMRRIRARPDHS